MADLSTFKAPFFTDDFIRKQADDFRLKYSKAIPVEIEEIIEFDLNLFIYPRANLYADCHTNAMLTSNAKEIRVDSQMYNNKYLISQMRYALAHEVGHFVLHNKIIGKIRPSTPEEWKETIKSLPEREYKFIEYHAYEFAGRLLVPKEVLVEQLKEREDDINHVYDEFPEVSDEQVIEFVSTPIAKFFNVSSQVITKRINVEGVWIYPL